MPLWKGHTATAPRAVAAPRRRASLPALLARDGDRRTCSAADAGSARARVRVVASRSERPHGVDDRGPPRSDRVPPRGDGPGSGGAGCCARASIRDRDRRVAVRELSGTRDDRRAQLPGVSRRSRPVPHDARRRGAEDRVAEARAASAVHRARRCRARDRWRASRWCRRSQGPRRGHDRSRPRHASSPRAPGPPQRRRSRPADRRSRLGAWSSSARRQEPTRDAPSTSARGRRRDPDLPRQAPDGAHRSRVRPSTSSAPSADVRGLVPRGGGCVHSRRRVYALAWAPRAPSLTRDAHAARWGDARRDRRRLRHRQISTTAIYSKVDVELLRQVAQPWPEPEGAPC